jgi:hypothetical protein
VFRLSLTVYSFLSFILNSTYKQFTLYVKYFFTIHGLLAVTFGSGSGRAMSKETNGTRGIGVPLLGSCSEMQRVWYEFKSQKIMLTNCTRARLVRLFSDQLFWKSGRGENLAVRRIWVSLRLRVKEDKVVHRAQDLENDGFLLLQRLNRLCVYVDFRWFLLQRIL